MQASLSNDDSYPKVHTSLKSEKRLCFRKKNLPSSSFALTSKEFFQNLDSKSLQAAEASSCLRFDLLMSECDMVQQCYWKKRKTETERFSSSSSLPYYQERKRKNREKPERELDWMHERERERANDGKMKIKGTLEPFRSHIQPSKHRNSFV